MPASSRLPDFQDRAPRDRYCDLILTGGVTSAIAYPGAIFALATTYRFNAIGGSSSGAGAAALAAAAEFRRRHGSSDGFRILLERTEALAENVDGRSGLAWLFQPAPRNRRLFDALLAAVAPPAGRPRGGSLAALRPYLGPLVSGMALACLIVGLVSRIAPQGWMAYVAWAVLGGAGALAFSFFRDLGHMVDGDYGLCSGMDRLPDAPHPTLIEWLHDLIQEIAGLRRDAGPLTFADLAAAPGSPRETLGDLSPAGAVSIRLQMFTANLNHGRPYVLPQIDSDPPLYFRAAEMRGLFPASVVDHMVRHSIRYEGDATIAGAPAPLRGGRAGRRKSGPASATTDPDEDALRLLPREQLPIVVAARLSVSFPVLFSAVPLWALEHCDGQAVMRRCLFSDGGLCSNFPIHLFDSPVPAWPTFGISLHALPDAQEGDSSHDTHEGSIRNAVHLPRDHREGHADRWKDFADRRTASGRLIGFLGALLSTTKDWNDATLSRLPGVRERVAQVGLHPGFGGLNILMTPEQIRHLGELGGEAGRRLLARFARPTGPTGVADGWSEHRWVRFNVLRDCLARSLSGLTWAASHAPYGTTLRAQIREAVGEPPLARDDSTRLLPAQAAALEGALAALMQAERSLTAPTVEQPYEPYPRPELRVRPPL